MSFNGGEYFDKLCRSGDIIGILKFIENIGNDKDTIINTYKLVYYNDFYTYETTIINRALKWQNLPVISFLIDHGAKISHSKLIMCMSNFYLKSAVFVMKYLLSQRTYRDETYIDIIWYQKLNLQYGYFTGCLYVDIKFLKESYLPEI
jgi:hypothetical protein